MFLIDSSVCHMERFLGVDAFSALLAASWVFQSTSKPLRLSRSEAAVRLQTKRLLLRHTGAPNRPFGANNPRYAATRWDTDIAIASGCTQIGMALSTNVSPVAAKSRV